MLELAVLSSVAKPSSPSQVDPNAWSSAVLITLAIYLLIFALAFMRALKCSSRSPDSRALHFMFLTLSPVMYLFFSFAVPGFCQ